jgi:hypothetical protein
MADYVIGPGVAQNIADHQDEARSDEQFILLEPGHKISQTFARDAIYYYYEEDNATRRVPF